MNTWATIVLGSKHLTILSKHFQLKRTEISIQQLCIIFPFPTPCYEQLYILFTEEICGPQWRENENWTQHPKNKNLNF